MSTALQNGGSSHLTNLPDAAGKRFAIVVSEWNDKITESLYRAAHETLLRCGAAEGDIIRKNVPGSFELPFGAQKFAQQSNIDAVICLGCVIRGETKHFDFICDAVAHGLVEVSLKYNKPVIFGVLTTETEQQAYARAGGKYGNKGEEAALAAARMSLI